MIACAEFAYNNPDMGLDLLERMSQLAATGCLGAIPEVLDGNAPIHRGARCEDGRHHF